MFEKAPLLERPAPLTRNDLIEQWIRRAINASGHERRRFKRHPIFQPITVRTAETTVAAFTRDVSRSAIGLVHETPLATGLATLQLSRPRIEITVAIGSCRAYHGWYISYGTFVGLSTAKMSRLALATAAEKVNRRLALRYPFFCPVALTLCSDLISIPAVFIRDISSSGVGLLHNSPLENQAVLLRIETDDPSHTVLAKIRWCRAASDGWYLSGATFERLLMEELDLS
jgi:hypothetical protein